MLQLSEVKNEFQFGHRCAPGTHQPALWTVCNRPDLRILEFGTGYFSTKLLSYMCKKLNHFTMSFENDLEWYKISHNLIDKQANHSITLVDDWKIFFDEDPLGLTTSYWNVVFVDQAPWVARHWTISKFKNCADYIIVHDSDMHPGFEFDYSPHLAKYEIYMPDLPYPYKSGPPTLIGSNIYDCKFNIINSEFD